MATDLTALLFPSNMKSNMGFRLAYLHLTLASSKGQRDCRNGVSPKLSQSCLFVNMSSYRPAGDMLHIDAIQFQEQKEQ